MHEKLEAPEGSTSEAAPAENAGEAVARLFAEHNAALIRFLRLRLGSDQDAREVAQEAYVRLLQLDQPGAISFLRGYLFRVATNLAMDRLRHSRVRRAVQSDPVFDLNIDEISPERRVVVREQLMVLESSLLELPENVRRAFLLQRLNGLSAAEAGRQLGLNERTARHYVVKALIHCRKRMDEAEGFAGEGR